MALVIQPATGSPLVQNLSSVDYTYGFGATGTLAGAATNTDVLAFGGAANVVTRIKRIKFSINNLSAPTAGAITVKLLRQTALAASPTAITPRLLDINATAALTTVVTPSGAGTGTLLLFEDAFTVPATIGVSSFVFNVGDYLGEPLTLRGATDFIALNVTFVTAQASAPYIVAGFFDEGTV